MFIGARPHRWNRGADRVDRPRSQGDVAEALDHEANFDGIAQEIRIAFTTSLADQLPRRSDRQQRRVGEHFHDAARTGGLDSQLAPRRYPGLATRFQVGACAVHARNVPASVLSSRSSLAAPCHSIRRASPGSRPPSANAATCAPCSSPTKAIAASSADSSDARTQLGSRAAPRRDRPRRRPTRAAAARGRSGPRRAA